MTTFKAQYKQHPLKQYSENPLLEALHFETNEEKLRQQVSVTISDFEESEMLSAIYQKAVVQELSTLHIPLPQFTAIYNKCAALLLNSYKYRNPMSADSQAIKVELGNNFHDKKRFSNCGRLKRTTAPSVLIHGVSGSGKTTTIRHALQCLPQVIEHSSYQGKMYKQKQLVWVSFDLPATASLKALALNFFAAVDDAIGTTYYEKWNALNRSSVDQYLNALRVVAETHELGLVHIDELQFMLRYAKSKESPTLTVLEALFNKLGIPVLLSCTSEGLELFRSEVNTSITLKPNITTSRRMSNDREFRFALHEKDSGYFNSFFEALFKWSLEKYSSDDINKFKDVFHQLSCGLPAIMTRLAQLFYEFKFDLIHKGALRINDQKIEAEIKLLLSVYNNQFSLIAQGLSMLRQGHCDTFEEAIRKTPGSKPSFTDKEQYQAEISSKPVAPPVVKSESDKPKLTSSNTHNGDGFLTGFGES
ncbi:AAA family ATPase [Pseudoalteromonas pernae]|uniref:AAA family ATPase n=1 Tax=Pseudoalteromonas pernae TaxID=3118054 RepID=UPI003242D519